MLDLQRFQRLLGTKQIGRSFIWRDEVDSTMKVAAREAQEGCVHGTVVAAELQTGGYGRVPGRVWQSDRGANLLCSVVLRVPENPLRLALIAPLAICEAARQHASADAWIKWPNDVWVGSRKVAGVLVENPADGAYVLGLGLNVFQRDPALETAISLQEIVTSHPNAAGSALSREFILASVCGHIEELLSLPAPELLALYKRHSRLIGRRLTVLPQGIEHPESAYEATAVGFTEHGLLQVRPSRSPSETRLLVADEVSVRMADAELGASDAKANFLPESSLRDSLSGSWRAGPLSLTLVAHSDGFLDAAVRMSVDGTDALHSTARGTWTAYLNRSARAQFDATWQIPGRSGGSAAPRKRVRWDLELSVHSETSLPCLKAVWEPNHSSTLFKLSSSSSTSLPL